MLDVPGANVWVPLVIFALGLIGILVRILPGLLLCLVAVGVWALDQGGLAAWVVFAIALAITAVGIFLQIRIPQARLRSQGVPTSTLVLAVVVALLLIPVAFIGPPLGFVGTIYLMQRLHSGDHAIAWNHTKAALRAIVQSIGIELLAAMAMLTVLITGMVLSR